MIRVGAERTGRRGEVALRNPDWTRDEAILALDLFMRAGKRQLSPSHPDVVELSRLMQRLPYHQPKERSESFRNPNGISMILGNFLGIDPEYSGLGLGRNNQIQKEVWDEFAPDEARLRRVAGAIVAVAELPLLRGPQRFPLEAEQVFPEGLLLTTLHLNRERNTRAVSRKKQSVLEKFGRLECEACGFDFEQVYGELGDGFAECHHIRPLAELPFRRETKLGDLAIVCSNCHRMLHRSRPVPSVESLKRLVTSLRKTATSSV